MAGFFFFFFFLVLQSWLRRTNCTMRWRFFFCFFLLFFFSLRFCRKCKSCWSEFTIEHPAQGPHRDLSESTLDASTARFRTRSYREKDFHFHNFHVSGLVCEIVIRKRRGTLRDPEINNAVLLIINNPVNINY